MSAQQDPVDAKRTRSDTNDEPTTAELLALFGDDYTRRVFAAVADQPRSGRAVAEAADVSRPTAYRRLNDLEDAGLVASDLVFCENGNHHEQYEAVVDSLSVTLNESGVEATVSRVE